MTMMMFGYLTLIGRDFFTILFLHAVQLARRVLEVERLILTNLKHFQHTQDLDTMENPTSVPELMQFVQATLQNMQEKFQNVEDSIVKRMTETGKRLDELEKGLTDLMDHSGMGEPYEEDLESDKDFSDTDKGR